MYLKLARQVSTDKGTNLRAGKHSAKRADYGTIGLHNIYLLVFITHLCLFWA
jgi:hypothetical protein